MLRCTKALANGHILLEKQLTTAGADPELSDRCAGVALHVNAMQFIVL